ncbi:Pvc16 family protein [Roseateles sp.]|uniref:Pvc16 family protein n=1 Tax=Roseateles sp. TaxID=1971397 RepID=UPI00326481D5
MALSASTEAVGAVSELLSTRVSSRLNNLPVLVGRPSDAPDDLGSRGLNLFLYRIGFDGHMRNQPLDVGQQPPLWLTLYYLLTAFDSDNESETVAAHRLLGQGLVALQELNFLRPAVSMAALTANPEPLKITFDEADADLLNKLFSGAEERYRVSAAFQVRPVMLATDAAPDYAPLVQTVGPGNAGVMVFASMGARLTEIEPAKFVAGDRVALRGIDLAGYDRINLGGNLLLPLAPEPEDRGDVVRFQLPVNTPIAAAGYAISVARILPTGRPMTSTPLLGELMPVVSGVALDGPLVAVGANLRGSFIVSGAQFGGPDESIFAALLFDGVAVIQLEPSVDPTATAARFTVPEAMALAPGTYRVVLRVNGQQALQTPPLLWT